MNSALEELGYRTIAVLPKEDPQGVNILKDAGVEVVSLNLYRIRRLSLILDNLKYLFHFIPNTISIFKLIKKYDIDIVQICGLMHIHGAIAAKIARRKIVWQILGTFAPGSLRLLISPIVALFADAVMVTGHNALRKHPFHKYFPSVTSFAPPVDSARFAFNKEKREKARKILNVSDQAFVIGTVGNQNKTKSHEKLVEIASKISDSHKDIFFRVIGNKTPSHARYYQEEVITKADKLGLFKGNKLSIMEYQGSPADILSGYDIFLLTSYTEGIPTVILEAMANGRPVISSKVGGVPEVVEQGINGFLYEFNDTDKAVEFILELYSDREKLTSIGYNNVKISQTKYDKMQCAKTHAEVYNFVMQEM
jgi:glycosyltransferase involved in cell wall biosynthesis